MKESNQSINGIDLSSIPKTWALAELAELGEIVTGRTPSTKETKYYNGPYMFISPGDINETMYVKNSEKSLSEEGIRVCRTLPKDTILVVCIGATIGKTALTYDSVCATNQQINAILINEKCIPNFLYYSLKYRANDLPSLAGRAAIPIINKSIFSKFKILLPPLPEQRAIARALRAVQAAREARLREIALERERKAALMEHLFTHGTRSEPTKMTEIGEMPESWSISSLGDLLRERLRNGHSACASNSNNGVRTLTLTAVTKNDFSVKNTKMTVADRLRVQDLWIEPGDIFIERANTPEFVGLASLYEGPREFAIFPDLMVRVRLREDEVDPKFLVEFLLTDQCRNYFRRNASSTTGNMPKIDHGIIERTKIPLTKDLSEQHKIAKTLRDCDAKIAALDHEARLFNELFRAMLEELMTGRLRARALATS